MVAVSGASGAVYARRLLEVLPQSYDCIYLTASDNAIAILNQELGIGSLADLAQQSTRNSELKTQNCILLDPSDMSAPPASGSHDYDGLVIIPCSMGVVGRVASGVSSDLVTRAADVCLKERRSLVLVVRETPLNLVHLRNLTALAEAGAVVLPACPAFYGQPQSIDDLVDFVVGRVLRALGTGVRLTRGWGE